MGIWGGNFDMKRDWATVFTVGLMIAVVLLGTGNVSSNPEYDEMVLFILSAIASELLTRKELPPVLIKALSVINFNCSSIPIIGMLEL